MFRKALAIWAIASACAVSACGQEDLHGAPNVKGLTLDVAKDQLKAAGYSTSVKDDAMFGVLIPSHFTVCKEHSPSGQIVPVDVSKQC